MEEVTSQLTGSKIYQERLRAMEDELEAGQVGDNKEDDDNLPVEEWDDRIPDDELELTKKILKSASMKGADRKVSRNKFDHSVKPGMEDLTHLFSEVKDALKDMALAMGNLASNQGTPDSGSRRSRGKPESGASSEDDNVRQGAKGVKKKAPQMATKSDWYYAVARGRIPGVYSDWGLAEKQVNGFPGSLHKKFRDRGSAQ
jgi:hypothetical protein